MPRNVYQFEILEELLRDGGNAIYSAKDTTDGSPIQLFEWNLTEEDSKAVVDKITTAQAEIENAELCSVGSSYYLAVKPERSKALLETLRARGLFTGQWANIFPRPVVVTPKTDQPAEQPKPAPVTVIKKASGGWIASTIVFGLAAAILLIMLIGSSDENSSKASRINSLNEEISGMRSKMDGLTNESSQASEGLAQANNSQRDLERAAAKQAGKLLDVIEERPAKPGIVYQTISLKNCGNQDQLFAIHYKSVVDSWVTTGWWKLETGRPATFTTEDSIFYYKIFSNPSTVGDLMASVSMDFMFFHEDGSAFFGTNPKQVGFTKADGFAGIGCLN